MNPHGVSALANLGVLLARTSRSDEAISTFESVLRMVPDHPQATLNLGLQFSGRGNDLLAIPLLQKAVSLGLDSYEVRYRLGVSLYNLQRFDEAKHAFETALTLSPNAAGSYYYLGLVAWAAGDDAQAADSWDHAVKLRHDFPEANFMLGEALRKNQRLQAAIVFYKLALDQDATKFVYYARLGGAYVVLRLPEQALDVFRRAETRFPNLPEAHYFLGVAARSRGDYNLAENEFRKALSLEPDNVNALAQLGFIVGERDRFSEAERLLRRAIAINNKHFYAHYDLGRLLAKSKQYEQALPLLQEAAALKPGNASVHYQIFIALSRLQRKDEAERELTLFKRLDDQRKARGQDDEEMENPTVENNSSPSPPLSP